MSPSRSGPSRFSNPIAILAAGCLLLAVGFPSPAADVAAVTDTRTSVPFRIGFSASVLGEMNRNDAIAAVKIWADALRKTQDIPLDPQPLVVNSLDEIRAGLADGGLDAINLGALEYCRLRPVLSDDFVLLGVQQNSVEEEFLLLVHRATGVERMADLRGKSLSLYDHPRVALAPTWLAGLAAEFQPADPTAFWGRISTSAKLPRAVLPVFFRQADACIATQRAFATLIELNPQVGTDLKIIARSPAVVPYMFAFRSGKPTEARRRIVDSIGSWHTTVPGRQILTLFQCDRIESHPVSALQPTLRFLEKHADRALHLDLTHSSPSQHSPAAAGPLRSVVPEKAGSR